MAEQEHDKSQQATPFKLQEAKRRGQVAKSTDFNSFAMIAGLMMILVIWGDRFINQVLNLARGIFSGAHLVSFGNTSLLLWLGDIVIQSGFLLGPFLVVAVVIGIVSTMAQTGPVFSFFPLKPDIQRLNPVQGFKRVFAPRMLFEAIKSVLKLLLFGTVAYFVVSGVFNKILEMTSIDPHAYPSTWLTIILGLIFKLAVVMLIVALLDMIYSRKEFSKKMRMSNREVKEEVKRREGDPQIRAKIKELQREAVNRSKGVARVPQADVLITNPTHFAVALKYDKTVSSAPYVLAKGSGELAQVMKLLAARHDVPVVEAPEIARGLFRSTQVGQVIPLTMYPAVARIFAKVMVQRSEGIRVEVGA